MSLKDLSVWARNNNLLDEEKNSGSFGIESTTRSPKIVLGLWQQQIYKKFNHSNGFVWGFFISKMGQKYARNT